MKVNNNKIIKKDEQNYINQNVEQENQQQKDFYKDLEETDYF